MANNVVHGRFAHYKAPPSKKAAEEKAHAAILSERMNNWLVEAETRLGLSASRAMLVVALGWIDMRRAFKRGAEK